MFGHQDDSTQPQNDTWNTPAPADPATPVTDTPAASLDDAYVASQPYQTHPAEPVSTPPLLEEEAEDGYVSTPPEVPAPEPLDAPTPTSTPSDDVAANNNSGDLFDIKQQALQQLSPLVGHLDQSAEERFRTTMMMIQASDNQDLIPKAYEAAGQITDEKVRAQALLDIINEINYFTQH